MLELELVVVLGLGLGLGLEHEHDSRQTSQAMVNEQQTYWVEGGRGGGAANSGTGGTRPCFLSTCLACSMLRLCVVRVCVTRADSGRMQCVLCGVLGVSAADTDVEVGNVMWCHDIMPVRVLTLGLGWGSRGMESNTTVLTTLFSHLLHVYCSSACAVRIGL